MSDSYTLFDTPIGACGIAWSEAGVVGVSLPDATMAATRARLCRRFPRAVESEPAPFVREAIAAIVALLSGERRSLADVPLDLRDVSPFQRRVYDVARGIAPGSTLTYGEIAARVGEPQAAREVGQAMGSNPCPLIVPCHRVLAAGGKTGGFSAHGGTLTKVKLLALEGAPGMGDLFA